MMVQCSLTRLPTGRWLARHNGPDLGSVEVSAGDRDEALNKMRDELQYRIELCPCSGAWGDRVVLQVTEER
jgi:hypothetical protein